jgi:hypothetical protein
MAKTRWFPRPVSPRTAIADFGALLMQQDRRHRLVFLTIAIGITSTIVTAFIVESRDRSLLPGPQTVYVYDWKATRTDSEIVAQQKIDQKALHEAKEERRQQFKRLDDKLTRLGF